MSCHVRTCAGVSYTAARSMHLALLRRVEATEPDLEEVMQLFEQYNHITDLLDSTPALSMSVQLQALNARVLAALTRKAQLAFNREAAAMQQDH